MKAIRFVTQKNRCIGLLAILSILTALSAPVLGEGPYKIPWQTIDAGGGTGSGGSFTLTGTIGQHDTDWGSAGGYEVLGGFWPGGPVCVVNIEHFARFAQYWLKSETDMPADLNEDGTIDELDLQEFANYWLCYCPYGWPLK
jgi:hypothetical protein